ncbi:16513_t:CDS:2, partial [Racocetra persica]
MDRESSVYGIESTSRQNTGTSTYSNEKDSMSNTEKCITRPPELQKVYDSLNQHQKDLYGSLPTREAEALLTLILEEKKRG